MAILGVLASYTLWSLGSPPAELWIAADRVIDLAGEILIDTKFVSLFAFLFGAGNARQWRRWRERTAATPLHVRRMLFLLSVGLAHGALLRNGDILAPYAILGLALMPAIRAPAGQLLAAAALLAVGPTLVQAVMQLAGWSFPPRPGPEAGNLDWLGYWYLTNPLLSWPRLLALMLLGVLAERSGVLERLAADAVLARRALLAGLLGAVGLQLALLALRRGEGQPPTLSYSLTRDALYHLAAWALAAAYAAGLALLCRTPAGAARLGWLRAVGRMAFTNYLLQALLVVPVCLALGLFDEVTPSRGLALALGVAAVQVPLSVGWLCRFPFGPMEWVWRRFTYGGQPRTVQA
jgi:uncharacterized protein